MNQLITGRGGAVQISDDDGRFFVQLTWLPVPADGQPEMATVLAWNSAAGATLNEVTILWGGGA